MNTKKNRFAGMYDQYHDQNSEQKKTKSERKTPKNRFAGMYDQYHDQNSEQKKTKSERKTPKNRFAAAYDKYYNSSEAGERKTQKNQKKFMFGDTVNEIVKDGNIDIGSIIDNTGLAMKIFEPKLRKG